MKRNSYYRRNKQSRISNKAGFAPGTVKYTGEDKNFHVVADVLTWDDEYFDEKKGISIEHIQDDISNTQTRWINVIGIHDISTIEHLGRIYNFHSLVQEDIAHATQRPKLDDYEDYLYVVAKMIDFDQTEKSIKTEQLSIILR